MSLGVFNSAAFLTASQLAVAAGATVEVRRESDSGLASIFSDRAGSSAITNPSAFADASGRFTFYVAASAGGFSILVTSGAESFTLRNVPIGLGQEFDIVESWRSSLAAAISATITSLLGAATALAARVAIGIPSIASSPGGRLTLTTAVPVTSADVSAATTVYYTPYRHDIIELYDGTGWIPTQFSELSQATTDATKSPGAVGGNGNYDVFVWNDAGTLRATRGPAWNTPTARGTGAGTTELEVLEGRYVNKIAITNGPAAQRGLYVGTIRSNASSQINDSNALRHVWNNYNRVPRHMQARDGTNSWTYSTGSFRQANGSTANQLDFVRGLDEDAVTAHLSAGGSGSDATLRTVYAGIGLDSTTTHAGLIGTGGFHSAAQSGITAHYSGLPGLGRHFLAWLEWGNPGHTTTWQGDSGGTTQIHGINGEMLA